MLADPSFLHKMTFELLGTLSSSVWCEMRNRKERYRFRQEWDLVFLNVVTATICNLAVFCSLAPCRSYMIQKLPNNIFEKSYPMRQFDLLRRTQSFSKASQLCLGGLLVGSIQGGLSHIFSATRERRLSMTVPSISTNALSYGAYYGLYANLQYQMLCGLDRSTVNHFDVLGVSMFFSTAMRLMNIQIGESSRRAWLGEEGDLLCSDNLLRACNCPVDLAVDQQQSGWLLSKNAIVSGLGLLGLKQQGAPEDASSKPQRKRIVNVPAS